MAEYSQKWHNRTSRTRSTKTSDGLAAIQAQLNNLRTKIKKVNEKVYAAQVGCGLCKGPYYTKDWPLKEEEIQVRQMSKVLQERGSESLPRSTETNPRDHVNSISTTVETDTTLIHHIGSTRYAVSAQQNSKLIFEPRQATIPFPRRLYDDCYEEEKGSYRLKYLDAYSIRTTLRNDALPRKEKDSGSFTLPCYINKVCFEKALADLGARVSVMPLSTYLNLGLGELAHTKLTTELAYKTVKHPKGIAKNVPIWIGNEKMIFKSVKPGGSLFKKVYMLSLRERIDHDLEARLMGETLILNRSFDPLYRDYIELNDLNEPQELRRNRVDDLEPTVEEVMKDIDPYLDEGIGYVIVRQPFYKALLVEARRFDGIINIRDGDDSVSYQMARSISRFKHLTKEKCKKLLPLLKVSEHDKMNGISHPYRKLKGFYKGVLNLVHEFIRDAKVEEWITCKHISIHEME
uniref:Reverse transcriptase domain-containing protein n=1 Tax=Tanacetum cinerariifolium TaxID=118510 RepID=A0A699HZG6_TANCI|nr:hypothetical protein [Tanacetum cinerariifolium]